MTSVTKNMHFVEAHVSTPPGMMFYSSPKSIRGDTAIAGYALAIERAWREMNLDGVLCLDGRPVLYLKEYGRPIAVRERVRLQKLLWNQGLANILVLADPVSVYIYSGLVRPQEDMSDSGMGDTALIETLEKVDYVHRIKTLYHSLATGNFYEENMNFFDPGQSVDSWLLKNLKDFRNDLTSGRDKLATGIAHAFIGRILFLCYLLDREIIFIGKPGKSETGSKLLADELVKISSEMQIDYLYELFENLKDRFNGNMFDQDLGAEKELIRPHLEKLMLFMGGHHVKSRQMTLFWPYDFKMIPVETISAIYQDFLTVENPEGQRKRGAFFTPRFLADMVVDEAVRDEPDAWDWTFFDPACGSGIFLVILFNRLAAHRLSRLGRVQYSKKAEALKSILINQIRGVDIEETACRITCFSLYLAYLDFFDPPDIEKYIQKTGEKLPRLLDYGDDSESPVADIPVIKKADFLSDDMMVDGDFDCIIGNPPWEGRGSKQVAQKFVEKTPNFLKYNGTGCLLLPTTILQNQTDAFQAGWLRRVSLEKVLQLADFRKLLFQGAKTPAFIARFKNTVPSLGNHSVEFIAPKFNRDGLRKGVIIVNPSSRTWISLADILAATETQTAPVVWKRRFWATPRDQKLIDLLETLPPLKDCVDVLSDLRNGKREQTKSWIVGQGLKPWPSKKSLSGSDRSPKRNHWPLDIHFVSARQWNSDLMLLLEDTVTLEERLEKGRYRKDIFYSKPPECLFQYPMVLVSQGFSKVAYCDFDALFQHSLQSISGPQEDAEKLMFLAAYLRSNLAKYYLFHTVANWGSERDKVHMNELLRVPFPLPGNDCISPDAENNIIQISEKIKELKIRLEKAHTEFKNYSFWGEDEVDDRQWRKERSKITDSVQKEIEPLIYQYFGLTDQEINIVEDTVNVFIPSSTPGTRYSSQTVTIDPVERTTVYPYAEKGLAAYGDTLADTLNTWAVQEGSDSRVRAEGGTDSKTGLAMVILTLSKSEAVFKEKELSEGLTDILSRYYDAVSKKNSTLVYERDILFFQDDQIHIIRPNILLNWTRTAAINDAARIYGEITVSRAD